MEAGKNLISAIISGNVKEVIKILSKIVAEFSVSISSAIKQKQCELARLLTRRNVSANKKKINNSSKSPLLYTVQRYSLKIVKSLKRMIANINF